MYRVLFLGVVVLLIGFPLLGRVLGTWQVALFTFLSAAPIVAIVVLILVLASQQYIAKIPRRIGLAENEVIILLSNSTYNVELQSIVEVGLPGDLFAVDEDQIGSFTILQKSGRLNIFPCVELQICRALEQLCNKHKVPITKLEPD